MDMISFSQVPAYPLADALQPEQRGVDVFKRHPRQGGGIVIGMGSGIIGHTDFVEHVQGVNHHARVEVAVGNGEEIAGCGNIESCLLFYLADDALLGCLIHVHKAAGKVERALGGFLATHRHKQVATDVADEGCRGRAGVGVIGEAAVGTVLTLEIVFLEVATAADGAEAEFI